MFVLENVPLSGYSTMRLGGKARYLTEISDRSEIAQAVAWAKEKSLPIIMIGGGSNTIWKDSGFDGLVIVNKITGYEIFQETEDSVYITVGSGEDWDAVVARTVDQGYSGLEFLSLIPGTAGATPIQNVGAYGQEISNILSTVQAYDTQTDQLVTIPAADCGFGYRTSRFKTTDKNRFFIFNVTFHLSKTRPTPPFYNSLQTYLDQNNIHDYTPKSIRQAVIAIRQAKLPDPKVVANNGSFFANPIVSQDKFAGLSKQYPTIVSWDMPNAMVKLSAAWLVEQAGFANFHDPETGMATWPAQTLVLVNEKAKSTNDLIAFKQKIVDAVMQKFGVALEQEPEILP